MEHARQGQLAAAAQVTGNVADAAAKWHALVETSGERIVVTDFEGFVLFTNAEETDGCPGPVGSIIFDLLTPTTEERLRRAFQRASETGKANVTEIELADDAEQTRCLEMRVVPIKEGPDRGNFIVIAADITSRRRVEEALRESQRFVTRVAEASPAIVYVYDLARSSYVYVNHQVSKILGFSSSEFMQKGFSQSRLLVHPDDVELLAERQRRLPMLKAGTVAECVFRMLNVRSEWVWVRSRETIFTRGKDGQTGQIIGMAEDITQRHTERTELEASREQLRALSARLQDVREAERAAISRRVHDELGQAVTALNMDLARIRKDLASLQSTANSAALIRIEEMSGIVAGMLQTVRQVSSELRPPVLDQFGAVAAIQWQAGEFEKKFGIACEVSVHPRSRIEDHDVGTAVFRIFQEVLTNIARHAGATRVRVSLRHESASLVLTIRDNGRGITKGELSNSLGVLGMQERAMLFGGEVGIEGILGEGTTVKVTIPPKVPKPGAMPKKETCVNPDKRRRLPS